ncbi:TRAP-type C4-dicarboxylate transport system, small permease component [Nereida ignava]|uniref:TRAP transporter small permease protein n=2 Tax=Rhodobacterales TaxID=204455 RepID=A0A0U1NNY7_9RHOB|nr:TRAP transporter small permease [Nereida ignava]CRK76454.1 TRAP-type C4-dicarboxylate transport system, small permease component [Nereida ignava]SFJ88878.1 TRAP-type mannitol/chloroaromatic compound transport system, small permease component [Nereida ignava DSM 16309]
MSRLLQKLYDVCGMIAGGLILCICLLISAQICLNAFGRFAPGILPSTIPSYADFSGFMLAGATFLAMAHTLRSGGHIRVNLVVSRLSQTTQFVAELFVLIAATGLIGYATYFMGALVVESVHYGDVSTGIVPVPLWIPQGVAAFGIGLLLVAVVHTLFDLLSARAPILSSPGEV